MASGGARARSGPAPDPMALRRDRKSDKDGWITLPAAGRTEPAPAWPLVDDEPSARELAVWESFWRKPQAVIWERDQILEPVAMFVRQYIEGMDRKASAENRKTVRMMFSDLYLTSDSMTRARIRIAPDELREKRAAPAKEAPKRSSSRSRFEVVKDVSDG